MTVALNLPIARYQFELQAQTPLSFPPYAGSTWRGAFGNALKRTVCVTRQPRCEGCLLRRSCVYSVVFETPAGTEPLLSKGNAAPHPFILHPLETSGQQYAAGASLRIQLTLLGQAIGYLPYFVHSIQQMGEHGVGAKLGRYSLVHVWQEQALGAEDWQVIYAAAQGQLNPLKPRPVSIPSAPEAIRVVFKTPFRARHEGHLMHESMFDVASFMMGLLRRLSLLSAYHTSECLELDFRALRAQAQQLEAAEVAFKWFEWTRYSSRQQGLIAMDGMLGHFCLSGMDWQAFWPWLWWGQWLHVGKGTVMGQGQYELDVLT